MTKKEFKQDNYVLYKTMGYARLFVLLLFISFENLSVFSQNLHRELNPNYTIDASVNGVDFYHTIVSCNGKNMVFLKFNNKNDHPVKISWKEIFVTKQIQEKKEGAKTKELILPKGEVSASDCSDSKNKMCLIQPQEAIPMYEADIEKYEFKDIKVLPAK